MAPICSFQVFAQVGNLTDPNMDTETLSVLTQCAKNMDAYKPPKARILDKYFELFCTVHDAEVPAEILAAQLADSVYLSKD